MSYAYNPHDFPPNQAHGDAVYSGGDHSYYGTAARVQPQPTQYISPPLLTTNPGRNFSGTAPPQALSNDPRHRSHHGTAYTQPSSSSSGSSRRPSNRQDDWGSLTPGEIHQLSIDVPPTPQNLLDGSYQKANALKEKDIVVYVPRRPDFSGPPSIQSILFSVNGRPGPYIRDIAKGRVVLDGAFDQIFYSRSWKQTWFTLEWPGVESSMEALSCFDDKGKPTTRTAVAMYISFRLCQFLTDARNGKFQWGPQKIDTVSKDWKIKDIDSRDVRLMALNYYRKTWIPVLAMDMEYD